MGKAPLELTGMRFGRLTVEKRLWSNKYGNFMWLCRCSCGNTCIVNSQKLKEGKTKSCGCISSELTTLRNKKAAKNEVIVKRLYRIYHGMKSRCYNKNVFGYYRYGGRGIKMCDEWLNSFVAFQSWALKNGYADNLSIDRINNDGDYEPNNCKWSTAKEQANNRLQRQKGGGNNAKL